MFFGEEASRKTHGVCFLREKQAKNPTPEANRHELKGKVCFWGKKQAEKHTACVFREKSKQKNPKPEVSGEF